MNQHNSSSHGYILVLAISILSILLIMVTYIYQRSKNHFYFTQTMIHREKAAVLAEGGLQLAMSQLSLYEKPETTTTSTTATASKEKKPKHKNNELLKLVLPKLNQWQTFTLTEDIDGIEGQIKLCISCEDGKLDLNALYDFEKKKFIATSEQTTDATKAYKTLFATIKKINEGKDLFELFEKFLKTRQYKLNDVTELLSIKEFQQTFKNHIFYEPVQQTTKKERAVYLTDLFTLWSGKSTMNPWLLSTSWSTILGLKNINETMDEQAFTKELDNLLGQDESKLSGTVQNIWDTTLQKLYTKDFKSLIPDLASWLASTFNATTFSILSYGTSGSITQKLYAIIERQDAQPCIIKKIYWL